MRLCSAAMLAPLLTACAHIHVGPDGSRHVVGLVHLALPPVQPSSASTSDWARVRAVGLLMTQSEVGNFVSVGYADSTVAAMRNDSCARLAALPWRSPASP